MVVFGMIMLSWLLLGSLGATCYMAGMTFLMFLGDSILGTKDARWCALGTLLTLMIDGAVVYGLVALAS